MQKRVRIFIIAFICVISVFLVPKSSSAQLITVQDTVDIMIICAHPGDEYLFLGGVLPNYVGEQGYSCVVVYLSSEDAAQRMAAKNSLARFGDNIKVEFGDFSAVYTSSEDEILLYWDKRAVTTYLVGLMREYRPTIVVSHDTMGEYGNGAHYVAAECSLLAVNFASSGTRYYDSLIEYGPWQVQRLFLHRYGDEENQVVLRRDQPLSHFGGLTALELDQQGYQYYPVTYPIEICDGTGYTSARYGLAFGAEGTQFDPSSGDLFNGLSVEPSGSTAIPTITPSPTPTPTQAAAPETTADTATSAVEAVNRSDSSINSTMIILVGCALFVIVMSVCIILFKTKKMRKRVFIAIGAVCFVTIVILCFYLIREKNVETSQHEAGAAQTASALPTETPTLSDSPLATPTPDPFDAYFLSDTDPEEVVINDQENEHWEYRTSTLSIIIDRIHISRSDGKPICYCVAQIRMREENAFYAGLHNEDMNAALTLESPCEMARRYRAVLAITGDNLTRSEKELKGILIRNKMIYSSNQAQDTLAFYPDELSMKIYKPNTITPQELLDQGVINTFSFGPTLLYDGVRDPSSKRTHLGLANPRCGIGMVEPGYFIAITVDGRQAFHSVGMSMVEFAQLFYSYGCQIAYNLDGGSSTAMVFMGENLSQHRGEGTDTQRCWTDALLCGRSELVPTVDDPIYYDGNGPWQPIP